MNKEDYLIITMNTLGSFIVLSLIWMGLEVMLYGAVQDRLVDNLMGIPILVIFWFMWKFKAERDKLRKG